MAATIKIKNSSTASAVPTSSDLVQGELAVNVTDKRIFTENASGTVVELGTNPSILTLPDGSASAPTLTNDGDTNTGIFFPAADTVGITTGGTERARVDSAGNLGLGVTPSAWASNYKAFQIGSVGRSFAQTGSGAGDLTMAFNAIYSSANSRWDYAYTGDSAARYSQTGSGVHAWYNAASGTAGNAITFTQAMTLDASGNLAIANTSPSYPLTRNGITLQAKGSDGAEFVMLSNTDTGYTGFAIVRSGANVGISNRTNGNLEFATNNTERARIDSSGNLLVGNTSTVSSSKFLVKYNGLASNGVVTDDTSSSGTTYSNVFVKNGSVVGTIAQTTTATAYNTSSDYRLKDITGSLTGYKERLSALQPKQGSWKINGSEFRGFLAHEFAESYPSSVSGEKDAVDADGNPQYQGMQAGSSEVIADLVAYIKELETRLSALEQA